MIFVPESPKWLYINFNFDEAREILQTVSDTNGLSDRKQSRLGKMTFDIEVIKKLKDAEVVEGSESKFSKPEMIDAEIDKRKETVSQSQYIINIVLMTIQWSNASFSFYLLLFMNKYYEGSIYVNNYLDAAATVLGSGLSILLYMTVKIQWSFIIGLVITLIGGTFVLCF